MNKGRFIVFEGIDGSGKSTHVKLLEQKLKTIGVKVYSTFEPTDNEIGKLLRRILSGEIKADERTIAALFMADRMEHLLNTTNGIIKKINEGITVICDRYYLSSVAYNCHDESIDWAFSINKRAQELLKPDITIFLDASIERAEKRTARRDTLDVYEKIEVQKKVRERYFESFAKLINQNIAIIKTDRDKSLVSEDIWKKVKSFFE